jgi:hypothetical protein
MKKNQIIRNNATGETLTMLVSDEDNTGACQLYEVRLPPHRPGPPLHYHVNFIETFTVKGANSASTWTKTRSISCFSPEKAQQHISCSHIGLPMITMSRSPS